jgi:hypothetical protein
VATDLFSLSPLFAGSRRAKLALEGWGEGLFRQVRLAESPPHPALSGRCGACHRARIRATRWHRRESADLSPQAGRGDRTRASADSTKNHHALARRDPSFGRAPDWPVERGLEQVEWAKEAVAGLRGTSPWLEQQFDDADQAVRAVRVDQMETRPAIFSHIKRLICRFG